MFKSFGEESKGTDERKLLEAKIKDKYQFAISKNKITNTDFLNMSEKMMAEKFLKENRLTNYQFFRWQWKGFRSLYFDFLCR